jgi:hypothetical protein
MEKINPVLRRNFTARSIILKRAHANSEKQPHGAWALRVLTAFGQYACKTWNKFFF